MKQSPRCLTIIVTLLALCARDRAQAAIDLTGDWNVTVILTVATYTLSSHIVQTGTTVEFFIPPSATPGTTGTIDVDTGVLSLSSSSCPPLMDSLSGVAASDGNSFTASGTVYAGGESGCDPVPIHLIGARVPCGDGVLDAGEQCDDGNNLPGDGCSEICTDEPPLDLTGTWISGAGCLQFSQSGASLTATYCDGSALPFSGIIDPLTGLLLISQPANSCLSVEPPFCVIDATATADGLTWSGTIDCSHAKYPFGLYPECAHVVAPVSGARERCGDGYTNGATGEQCDDGNTDAGDCCSPTCQYEPAGSPCSDGNPATCEACGAFGNCAPLTCPTPLDHYKCYSGEDLQTPPLTPNTVAASDQITSESVRADKLKYVCAPVDKNGEGINDPNSHLACYTAKGTELAPRPQVEVSTQFQTSRFELKRSFLLCVPATKTVLP